MGLFRVKFLILEKPSFEAKSDEMISGLHYSPDYQITMIECAHPIFDDNVVQIEGDEYLKDRCGVLYLFSEHYSALEIGSMFELED